MAPFGLISVGNVLVRTLGLVCSAGTVRCSSIAPALKHFCTSVGARPKHPVNAYLQYVKTQHNVFRKQYPDVTQMDLVRKIGQQWQQLTPEQKRPFEEMFLVSKEQYKIDMKKYMEQLTPAQVAAIKQERREKIEKRLAIRKKKELDSLGKPKRGRTPFNIFMAETFEEAKGNTLKEKWSYLMDHWKSLDASQKKVYEQLAEDDKVRYKNEMIAWEEHMTDLGKEHLIRKMSQKSVVKKDKKKKPQVAKKSTEKGEAIHPAAKRK